MPGEPIMASALPGDEPGREGAASQNGAPTRSVLEQALKELVTERAADDVVVELFPGSHPGHNRHRADGPWFVSGSALDRMPPGPKLAAALEDTWAGGLTELSDAEIAGVILAWRRCESRAAAGLLAALGELSRRREAGPDQELFDHLDDEVSVLLTLTRPAAQGLLGTAASITRLPATMGALAAGRIDRYKADVIAYETALLDADMAAAVEQLVIENAPDLTSSRLRARLRRAVLAADPDAARRRQQRAAQDARVELFDERAGTAGLAGRDLPVAGALAADQRIDAAARALKKAGEQATLAQLRAAVFLGLLTGHEPRIFLPSRDDGQTQPGPQPGQDPETARPSFPDDGAVGSTDGAAGPGGTATGSGGTVTQPGGTATQPAGTAAGPGEATASPNTAAGRPAGDSSSSGTAPARGSADSVSPSAGAPDSAGTGPLIARGSVHLTVPLAAWLGFSQSPGDITGFGPASADTCRELADLIAQNPASRWCLTLLDKKGRAVGHACARRPPPTGRRSSPGGNAGPPGDGSSPPGFRSNHPPGAAQATGPPGAVGGPGPLSGITGWLAGLRIEPIEAGTCSHAREVPGYRIPESLHHVVKVRQRTCSFPTCNRPAVKCDDDHTWPHHKGGRTCDCNLGPLCRNHHRVKQGQGWHLTQLSPGVFAWELPLGRRYVVTPDAYPV